MNLKTILLCFFVSALYTNVLLAQEEDNEYTFKSLSHKQIKTSTKNDFVFKLSFLTPAAGVEFKLAERFSLDISGRLGWSVYTIQTSSPVALRLLFFPQPKIHIEPKWNYNILRRNALGKKTDKFSSNFLSLHTHLNIKVSLPSLNSFVIGPTWGMQRNFGKYGYFKFKSGLGYRYVFNAPGDYVPLVPIINVNLGIMF